jgi:hypothetical protein
METWFLRKEDGVVYGPNGLDTLREWAAAARIEPSDCLSVDQQAWVPAHEVAGLEMNWLIELEEGGSYGPVHVRALLELAGDGTLPGATRIRNARDGRRLSLRALTLIEGATPLRPAEPEKPVPVEAAGPGPLPPSWQSMARERDRFQKESDRWQERYEREIASAEEALRQVQADLRTREEETTALRSELDRLRTREEQLRRQLDRRSAESPATDGMDAAFLELTQGYETLAGQLTDKAEELDALRGMLARSQTSYAERIAYLEKEVEAERKDAREAREALARSEEACRQTVHSLRELNFHYIQFRENRAQSAHPVSPAPDGVPSGNKPTTSRVRLTR